MDLKRGDRLSNRVAVFGTLAMWLTFTAPPRDLLVIFNNQSTLMIYATLYGNHTKKNRK